jgi:hypothetical protein
VIAVGDLHEIVPAMTRARLLVGGRNRLDEDAGRIGRDAERMCERVVAHRGHDGRTDRGAELLEPAAHRAAIDACTESREAIFLAVQRETVAELVARNVREQRRCGECARDQLARDLGRRDRGGIAVADLVLDARDDEANVARTPPHELVAVLGPDAIGAPLERRIGQLDALLGHVELGEATSSFGLGLGGLLASARLRRSSDFRIRRTIGGEAGELVELAQLGGKLELELCRVDALGFGDDEAAPHQLDLELQVAVALAKAVALGGQLVSALPLFRERHFELRHACRERSARRSACVLDHSSALPMRDRSVEISRSESAHQCVVARRFSAGGSRSTPSSKSSSTRSSIKSCVVPSGTCGSRNVPASRRL